MYAVKEIVMRLKNRKIGKTAQFNLPYQLIRSFKFHHKNDATKQCRSTSNQTGV